MPFDWHALQFSTPWWGLALPALMLLAWLHRRFGAADDLSALKNGQIAHFRHPLAGFFRAGAAPTRQKRGRPPFWLPVLRWLALLLLVLALMGPGREAVVQTTQQVHSRHTLMFVVESSVTMTLPDYRIGGKPVSRMMAVRQALDGLMAEMDAGRYGLVLYGETAGTLLPLTFDKSLFRQTLTRLKPYLLGRTDEGVGAGLGLALRSGPLDGVVLISDGLNQPGGISLADVVALARSRHTPIFTVGVGAGRDTRSGRHAGLIYQPLDAAPLKKLADLTGGRFYAITDSRGLRQALSNIRAATGTHWTETVVRKRWQDYRGPLVAAVLAVVALYLAAAFFWIRREHHVPL
ncbi:VWA domain-containing protein [Sulfurivirga sp.]|uniref:vWA domain-containing protein n=1 Tax=Sulfurivirga sp. TaxID=2614236 RepID=UPI0025D911D9|nr:VWA domain-containing protein [Sulfurivirga sp.]